MHQKQFGDRKKNPGSLWRNWQENVVTACPVASLWQSNDTTLKHNRLFRPEQETYNVGKTWRSVIKTWLRMVVKSPDAPLTMQMSGNLFATSTCAILYPIKQGPAKTFSAFSPLGCHQSSHFSKCFHVQISCWCFCQVFEPFSCVPVDVSFTLYPWEKHPQTQPGSFLHVWNLKPELANLSWTKPAKTEAHPPKTKLKHGNTEK